jgi:AraC-like DNA-binding protein
MDRIAQNLSETDQFLVQAAIGRDLPAFCAGMGIDLAAFARAVDLDPAAFDAFDAYISLDRLCRLMKAISVTMADDAFGLHYGLFYKAGGTGPFGLGLNAAPTFGDMLEFYRRYVGVVVHSETNIVTVGQETFSIEWSYSPLIAHQEQYSDFSACAVLRAFSGFAGQRVLPLHGHLKRAAPINTALYEQTFTGNIVYGASTNRLFFPASLLALENPAGNSAAFAYMSQQCDAVLDRLARRKTAVAMVVDDLTQHLGRKNCGIGAVARRIGVSERTLQRRLHVVGTDFSRLFETTRDGASVRLLTETEKPVAEIADLLGYGSQSAYARAVKRVHGLTPRQIRSAGRAIPRQ